MIAPIIKPKKIGRNDLCLCGSGKKYKMCCMPKAEVNQQLNEVGMWAIFRKLVKDSENGQVEITLSDLQKIPLNEALVSHFDIDKDKFTLKVAKVKKSPIIQMDKRIRV